MAQAKPFQSHLSDMTSLMPQDLPLDQVDKEQWWTMIEVGGIGSRVGLNFGDAWVTCCNIKITSHHQHTYNDTLQPDKLHSPKSHGLMAWVWLLRTSGQAKAIMKPSTWPSLAWLMASGQARHSTIQVSNLRITH